MPRVGGALSARSPQYQRRSLRCQTDELAPGFDRASTRALWGWTPHSLREHGGETTKLSGSSRDVHDYPRPLACSRHSSCGWPMRLRMPAWTIVVPFESRAQIICQSDIVSRGINVAADDVNDAFLNAVHAGSRMHRATRSHVGSQRMALTSTRMLLPCARGPVAESAGCYPPGRIGSGEYEEVRLRPLRGLRRDSLRLSIVRDFG